MKVVCKNCNIEVDTNICTHSNFYGMIEFQCFFCGHWDKTHKIGIENENK